MYIDNLRNLCGDYTGYSPQPQQCTYWRESENKNLLLHKQEKWAPRLDVRKEFNEIKLIQLKRDIFGSSGNQKEAVFMEYL
jgi:hypothetical protein